MLTRHAVGECLPPADQLSLPMAAVRFVSTGDFTTLPGLLPWIRRLSDDRMASLFIFFLKMQNIPLSCFLTGICSSVDQILNLGNLLRRYRPEKGEINRSRSGATRNPACFTWTPRIRHRTACMRCVEVWFRAAACRRGRSTLGRTASPELRSPSCTRTWESRIRSSVPRAEGNG